jgi:hypothetical protein
MFTCTNKRDMSRKNRVKNWYSQEVKIRMEMW